jgi:hypothetical protein
MPHYTDIAGLAGVASAMMAAVFLLLSGVARISHKPRMGFSRLHLAGLLLALFVLVLIPFGGMPVAAFVRGATGDLSITTLVLLWCALLRPWCDCATFGVKHRNMLLMLITLAAVMLYPLALGVGVLDPYRFGYGNPLFIVALFLIASAAWVQKSYLITLCISLAALAWVVGWYESSNLWDYLLDPFLSAYALCSIIIHAAKRLVNRSPCEQL